MHRLVFIHNVCILMNRSNEKLHTSPPKMNLKRKKLSTNKIILLKTRILLVFVFVLKFIQKSKTRSRGVIVILA